MRTNVLQEGVKVDLYGPSQEGIGFGLDFAIVMDPAKANTPPVRSISPKMVYAALTDQKREVSLAVVSPEF